MSFTPYDVVDEFEKTIAEYAGAKYGVAVDSCCNALLLSCQYYRLTYGGSPLTLSIPKFTYPGVACAIINSGNKVEFDDRRWKGIYNLGNRKIWDGALRSRRGMYHGGLHCLSFHIKKHLPIGRGGMILCGDKWQYEWLKKARFDGRAQVPLNKDKIQFVGWNCYMTPGQAARGLMLFETIKDKDLPDIDAKTQGYPDLSLIKAYQ